MVEFRAIGTAGMQVRRAQRTSKEKTLRALYKHAKTHAVRDAVVSNSHTPLEILVASYKSDTSKHGKNREKILAHPKVQAQLKLARESQSADELAELSQSPQSPFYEVRLEAARNPNNSPDALARLAFEPPPVWDFYGYNEIQRAADANPNTPPETLIARALGFIPKTLLLELDSKIEKNIPDFFIEHEDTGNLELIPGDQIHAKLLEREFSSPRLKETVDILIALCHPSQAAALNQKVPAKVVALHMTRRLSPYEFTRISEIMERKENLFTAALEDELRDPPDNSLSKMGAASRELEDYVGLNDILSVMYERPDRPEIERELSKIEPKGPVLLLAAREISEFDKRIP